LGPSLEQAVVDEMTLLIDGCRDPQYPRIAPSVLSRSET